jgi:hypothetical protein
LIPSAFFVDENYRQQYPDLDFSYIHDKTVPDHRALLAGEPTDWYIINNEIWKNPGTNLKRTFEFTASEKQDAKNGSRISLRNDFVSSSSGEWMCSQKPVRSFQVLE